MSSNIDNCDVPNDDDWLTGVCFLTSVLMGCFIWAWGFDSDDISAPLKWLGQASAISASILIVTLTELSIRRRQGTWTRALRGPITGIVLVAFVWGSAALVASWCNEKAANGAWCFALGVFGFVSHKLQQPKRRVGFMTWIYGLFILIGAVSFYASIADVPSDKGSADDELAHCFTSSFCYAAAIQNLLPLEKYTHPMNTPLISATCLFSDEYSPPFVRDHATSLSEQNRMGRSPS